MPVPSVKVTVKTRKTHGGSVGMASITKTFRSNVNAMAYNYAQRVESGAKRRVHVITGYLRDSIKRERLSTGVHRVTVHAHYGVYEEYGTRHRPPHPFFRPAVDDAKIAFKRDLARLFIRGGVVHR